MMLKKKNTIIKDEPGEFVGKIVRNDPLKDFGGYRDKAATEKKVLKDVMNKGDAYFRWRFRLKGCLILI